MTTRRENVQTLLGEKFNPTNVNASLWFDKFIYDSTKTGKSESSFRDKSKKDETAKTALVEQVTKIITEPPVYENYFDSWEKKITGIAECRQAKVKNRLAINLGSESVLETSIALHRLFGVPFIPGSALKGSVSHFIHQYGGADWKIGSENHAVVFGNQDNAGFVIFHDALYVPGSGFNKKPLYADVMTTHHSEYYGGANVPPADWDSPNPVPFISATGTFLIALSGPTDWVELTFDILGFALAAEGIGAKTSSGYGRMWLLKDDETIDEKYELQILNQSNSAGASSSGEQTQNPSDSEKISRALVQRINALRKADVAGQINNFVNDWKKIEDETAKRQVATAIKQKVVEAGREKASAEKDWFKQISLFAE